MEANIRFFIKIMIKILLIFGNIGFIPDKDGTYIGRAFKFEHGKTRFEFKKGMLICTVKDDIAPIVLFSIHYDEINIGTFLVILQEYGIINFDCIKGYTRKIGREMEEYFRNDEEHI